MLDIDALVGEISNSVRGGRTPSEAVKRLLLLMGNSQTTEDMLKQALKLFEEKTGRIRTLKDPAVLEAKGLEGWYDGPSQDDKFWPSLKTYLLDIKNWSPAAVDSLDTASTRIISLLQPPGKPKFKTKGLVVGYVQSGKTANFTAAIAKAADVNYKFFIVLSGITNSLRSQTQRRLETELSLLNPQHWVTLTTVTDDFRKGAAGNVNAFLTDHQNLKVLCVIKKNAAVLKRLLDWLAGASEVVLNSCPVLIIDDEADQASINASQDAERKRTAINERLIKLLGTLPKAAYVGYTATPFANVFIDPTAEDLYPKDFIVSLPKPKGYFGAEYIFGRERLWNEEEGGSELKQDMIRIVSSDAVPLLQPGRKNKETFEPSLSPSLEQALNYYWMAVAARLARGQADQHMTMLIHTSMFTIVHDKTKPLIENYQKQMIKHLQKGEPAFIKQIYDQWQHEQSCVNSQEFGELPLEFNKIEPYLLNAAQSTHVVVDNYRSQQRLSYEGAGRIQIVIGGDTLSRGLTLEGLTVSYFVRAASAYDTLLQMGRWFGYRAGYADLTRMWMTLELAHWFYDLATIEEEIRIDIQRYHNENLTPMDFAVRVRTHPSLSITSALKMQRAILSQVSYNNKRVQTVLFKRKNLQWLSHNLAALRLLIDKLASQHNAELLPNNNILFRQVSSKNVIEFLKTYRVHEESRELSSDLLVKYIQDQNSAKMPDLLSWNIVVISGDENRTINIGGGIELKTIKRTRRNEAREDANIGSLMSQGDVNIDLAISPLTAKEKSDTELLKYRPQKLGLLIIYPISKTSGENEDLSKLRQPLDAVEDVIALGLVFPQSQEFFASEYMSVDLSNVPREESEWDMDQEDNVE